MIIVFFIHENLILTFQYTSTRYTVSLQSIYENHDNNNFDRNVHKNPPQNKVKFIKR